MASSRGREEVFKEAVGKTHRLLELLHPLSAMIRSAVDSCEVERGQGVRHETLSLQSA